MSKESVEQFLSLIASDTTMEAALNVAAEQRTDVAATAVELGEERGLEFTADEFNAGVEAFHDEQPSELDDAALEGISAGFNPQPEPPALGGAQSYVPWSSQKWASRRNW
ncbi:MAG: Nif11-like leader peptide family natural product precursor [Thermoanaerobaculales bacterium]